MSTKPRSALADIPQSLIADLELRFPEKLPSLLADCTEQEIARRFGHKEVLDFIRDVYRRQN